MHVETVHTAPRLKEVRKSSVQVLYGRCESEEEKIAQLSRKREMRVAGSVLFRKLMIYGH